MFKKFFNSFKKQKEEVSQQVNNLEESSNESDIIEDKINKDLLNEKEDKNQDNKKENYEDKNHKYELEENINDNTKEENKEIYKIQEVSEDTEELEENKEDLNDNNKDYKIQINEGSEKHQSKISLFERLKEGLNKTKKGITDKIDNVLKAYTKVDEELLEELEEILITSDVGVNTTMEIIEKLRDKVKENKLKEPNEVKVELKSIIEEILTEENSNLDVSHAPTIILMVGVNGVGKTTTIGKLTRRYKEEGKKVLVAAGDTFRAAAIEQLEVWTSRSNVEIIKHQEGADPGAVIFDAIKAAKSRKVDILICDTAGRLHNKSNLMNELSKVFKIVDREFSEAKKEVLLVVDATTGQNAVSQAKTFKQVCDITGIVLTKLDGTAKGGVVLAVKNEVNVPVKLIGVGEQIYDLQDFNAKNFVDALFGENQHKNYFTNKSIDIIKCIR